MSQREARNGPSGVVETKAGAQPRSPTPNDAAAALHAAVEHHQADRLDEAEALYRRILRSHPEHPDALNLLGVIVQQRGEHATAEELIRKAIRSSPRVADYHNNLGKVLVRQGKIDEAVAYFRKAERLGPRDGRNIAAFRISFLDEDKARKGEPYVKRLKDVLVDTAYWSILDRDKIYSRETHGKNLANSPFIKSRINPDRTRVIAVYPDPEVIIKERCIFVGGDSTYSLWILRNLMKLSIIENDKDLQSLPLLLATTDAPYQWETLELLGIRRDRQILVNRNSIVKCHDIYVPTQLRNHPKMKMGLEWLRRKFLTGRETPSRKSRDRIFVSRRDAARRHIVNEEELADRLAELGFKVVVPGQLSFSEQVETFSNASIVVGAHGAGLANIVFAPLDCRMVEITSTNIEHMNCFRRICRELGQEVVNIVSDAIVPPSGKAKTLTMHYDFMVDIEEVVSVVMA